MSHKNIEYNLRRTIERLGMEMEREPIEKLLLSVLYLSNLFDAYMGETHKLQQKRDFYNEYQSVCQSLNYKINSATKNQYFVQKQNQKSILGDIGKILEKYAELKTNNVSISLLLQTTNPTFTYDQIRSELELCKQFHSEYKIQQAYSKLQMVKEMVRQDSHIKEKFKHDSWERLNLIEQDYHRFQRFASKLADMTDWNMEIEEKQRKSFLHYKVIQERQHNQNGEFDENLKSTLAIRLETDLKIEPLKLLILLLEPQLFIKYLPLIEEINPLKGVGLLPTLPANIRTATQIINIPGLVQMTPLSFYTMFYDQLEEQSSFTIFAKSLQDDDQFRGRYHLEKTFKEQMVNLQYCCIEVKPINRMKAHLRMVVNPYIKAEYFQFQILKKAARIFYSHFFTNLCNCAGSVKEGEGVNWSQVMKGNRSEFYRLLEHKVQQFFANNR